MLENERLFLRNIRMTNRVLYKHILDRPIFAARRPLLPGPRLSGRPLPGADNQPVQNIKKDTDNGKACRGQYFSPMRFSDKSGHGSGFFISSHVNLRTTCCR